LPAVRQQHYCNADLRHELADGSAPREARNRSDQRRRGFQAKTACACRAPGKDRSLALRQLGSTGRTFRFVDGPDPKLVYEIEQAGFVPVRGVLAWELSVNDEESHEWYEVHVDAATGRLIRVMPFVH
jgi:hypothetical protein